MSQKPHHFRIGLFVLGGAALVVLGLLAFGFRNAFETRHRLVTYVPGDVEGIVVGSPVKLKGVNVGEVVGLYFSWNRYPQTRTPCVILEFEVKDSLSPVPGTREFALTVAERVAAGLRAIVKSQPVTGTAFVELEILDPKRNPPFANDWAEPRYPYVPSAPSEFTRVFAAANRTMARLERIDTEKIGKQVESTLAAAETALTRFGRLDVEGISDEAKGTVRQAAAVLVEVQALTRDARAQVQAVAAGEISQDLRRLLASIERTNEKAQTALDGVGGVDVRALNETLADLRLAARGLAEAAATVRRQPSQLILGGAPPPAGSLEREVPR